MSVCHSMQRAGVKRLVSLFLLVTAACGNPGVSGFFSPAASLPPLSPPFESETWIVSGQSNAVGCGRGASLDISPSVEMWNGAGWQPAHEPLAFMEPFAGCHVGPWVAAANALNRPVKLTGWGRVGMPISAWENGAEAWQRLESIIAVSGHGAAWFMWFQGETDAVTGDADGSYGESLEALIRRVRDAAKNPRMKVLIVGLADAPRNRQTGYALIRKAQQQVAERDPRAFFVSAEGLPTGAPASPYHLTTAGYRALGSRIAAMVRSTGEE